MAWEWFDNLKGFNGQPGYSSASGQDWNSILNAINVGNEYTLLTTQEGQYLHIEDNSDYCFNGTNTNQKNIDSGQGYSLIYKSSNYFPTGGVTFQTTIPIPGSSSYRTFGYGGITQLATVRFAVNHATQTATMIIIRNFQNGPWYCEIATGCAYQSVSVLNELYNYLMEHMAPTYTWSSVPAISGKNGVLSLGMIADENIGDGNPVTGADYSYLISKPESARIGYISGLSIGQTIDFVWSGNRFKATVTYVSAARMRIDFFLNQTTPGTWTAFYSYEYIPDNEQSQSAQHIQYLGFIIDDENEVAALNIIHVVKNLTTGVSTIDYCDPGTGMSESDMHLLWGWIKGSFIEDGPLDSFVDNEGDGGGSLVNRINNPIPTPGLPNLSATDTGFISMYLVGKTELNNLAKFLWSDSFVDAVKKFFNDPMEIIIGLMIFPLEPRAEDKGAPRTIKGGNISTGITGTPLVSEWGSFDFGECTIEKRLQRDNTAVLDADRKESGIYFDYSPYTECKIYLPYCGEHSLDLNDVMGRTLSLKYSVDYLTGACVAHLTMTNKDDPNAPSECHYNFSGQMGVQIPVSQADYRQRAAAMIGSAVTVGSAIATIATGGLTAPVHGAAAKAAGVNPGTEVFQPGNAAALGSGVTSRLANNVANMHPTVQHTSGGGAVTGSLSSEYPYIMISEPDVFEAENQPHYKGYPINSTYKIGDFSGFVQIENVHLDGLSCTESERETIARMLANGVIVNTDNPSSEPDSSAPAGEFAVVFLKNKSDPETIGKRWDSELKITGKLLYSQDINHLRLKVKGNFSAYNYAFIKVFNRYYYINTFEIDTGDLMIVDMTCDPLQSFKDEILEVPALIDSAEDADKAKMLVNNGYWYMRQNKIIKTLTFKKNGADQHFDRSSAGGERFILTIAGDTLD